MRIIPLKCSQCSAPLDVPADREQITCVWCGAILHVSKLKPAPAAPPGGDAHPLQAELDQLDAEWEQYRATYLAPDGSGEYVVPEPEACRMGAWATGIIGLAVSVFSLVAGSRFFVIVPIVVAGLVIAALLRQAKIAPVYQRSLENYRHARQEILGRMENRS